MRVVNTTEQAKKKKQNTSTELYTKNIEIHLNGHNKKRTEARSTSSQTLHRTTTQSVGTKNVEPLRSKISICENTS